MERRRLQLFRKIHPAMENHPGPVLLQGEDRSIRFVNRSFRQRFGGPEGKHARKLLPERKETTGEEEEAPREWTVELSDGCAYTVRALPFTEADGARYTLLVGTEIGTPGGRGPLSNVRQRRRLEEMIADRSARLEEANRKALELLASEEAVREKAEEGARTLTALMEDVPEGLAIADADLRFRWISRSMAVLVGKPVERLLEHKVGEHAATWGICRSDGQPIGPQEHPLYRAILHGEMVREDELLLRRPDGRTVNILSTASPIRDRKGEIAGGVTIWRDITERKRIVEELRKSEERLRFFIAYAPAALAMFDREMRYLYASRRWMTDYGLGDRDLRGLSHYQVFPEVPEVWKEVHRRGLSGEVLREEADRFLRADGTVQWVRWEIRPWFAAAGDIGGIVIFSEDITERKRMEEQLRHSQRLESVGRLAGGVSHDFNNLLTVINGYGDLLLARLRPGDPNRAMVEQIRQSGERAAALTGQLLAFSRKQTLQPKVLNLNGVVANMERMLRRLIGEDVSLVVVSAPDLWPVKVDPVQIEQVIVNLAVNARDAMPRGGRLKIETENVRTDEEQARRNPVLRPGSYVRMAVSDTGVGMDEHTRARIFEPFFTTKEEGKGTGLGLATVYGIVKQSGGHIRVRSEPGKGTTFSVEFPREAGEREAAGKPEGTRAPGGTEEVLVVEDEEVVRELVLEVLKGMGYTVMAASNGEDALRILRDRAGTPLVVTDVVMPGMSGPELAERIRDIRPDARILFMSGYTDSPAIRDILPGSGTEFLPKPFTRDELAGKVRSLLDRGTGGRKAA